MSVQDVTVRARQMLSGLGIPADAVTPNSLLGIGVILALLYIYGLSLLMERSAVGEAALATAQTSLQQQVATLNDPAWPARRTEALATLTSLQQRLWPGETPGLARASYQQWIGTTLRQVGIQAPANFSSTGSGVPGYEAYQATVTTPVSPDQVLKLLELVAGQKALIEVTSLDMTTAQQPRASLTLSSFIRVADEQTAADPRRAP